MFYEEQEDAKFYGFYPGVVINREDPEQLRRVKVRIPGMLEETGWALPVGTDGGSKDRGRFFTPAIGADVVVGFLQGNPDRPFFMAAHWGRVKGVSEIPDKALDLETDVIETERWFIQMDNNPGSASFVIQDKLSGANVEFDGVSKAMRVYSPSALILESTGFVSIKGLDVTINGRKVLPNGKPI